MSRVNLVLLYEGRMEGYDKHHGGGEAAVSCPNILIEDIRFTSTIESTPWILLRIDLKSRGGICSHDGRAPERSIDTR